MTTVSVLEEVNEAILDLQSSDYNTYERPLKRLAHALESGELKPIIDRLRDAVDFDAFVAAADKGGSFAGTARLNWPTNREEELGLAIVLIERGAKDPEWFLNFAVDYYYGGSQYIRSIRKVTSSVIIPFGRDFRRYVEHSKGGTVPMTEPSDRGRVFIVHGRDEAPREKVARLIEKLGLDAVILHEQANRGMTVPEKLEKFGNVGHAVVLLTPDDVGREKSETEERSRARQNVILELGYFVGRLGRERVTALLKDDLEMPSDYLGVVYTRFDEHGAWCLKLARELQSSGYAVDLNRAIA